MDRRTFLSSTAAITLPVPLALGPGLLHADGHGFPYRKSRMEIAGHQMAYVDTGAGQPIVFLHGNPTSSYLWRNIITYVTTTHRAIAPDLIGMGDSDQPDLAYTYADHAEHLHGLLDALDLQDVILVLHDWGSALGFDWAEQNRDRVSAIAFMEAMLPPAMPFASLDAMGPPANELFAMLRSPAGEEAVLQGNVFVEEILRNFGTLQPLSDDVMAAYRAPFPTPASRRPTLQWPREVPIAGEPAHTAEVITRYGAWMLETDLPKLMFHVTPGALIPPPAAAFLQANMTNLTAVDLGPGAHFIQEDYPDEIGQALADWTLTL